MELPAVDVDRLQDLSAGDVEFLQELVDMYIEDAENLLIELQTALRRAEPDELARTAHKLKGSSANMGANRVSETAKALEQLGKSEQFEDADRLMAHLESEIGFAKKAFQGLLVRS